MSKQKQIGEGYHILAKPAGPLCNLNCEYCYYSEKEALFPKKDVYHMSDKILEDFISKYIKTQKVPEVQFVWQGGEPTLMGLEFFRKLVALQKKYAGGKKIINSLQTNGTLLNDEWCKFLKENNFLVGLSLDGPELFHDRYRFDHKGQPTWARVINALSLLKKNEIPFNVMVCVTRESSLHPLEIYRFLKEQGVTFVQFTPIVERIAQDSEISMGLRHASPLLQGEEAERVRLSASSVESEAYGDFLIKIFDEWVRKDVGSIFVMNFEWALESWLGLPSTVCIFSKRCGMALAIEHNGDIYACDHYVYPEYRLGNISSGSPLKFIESIQQVEFGLQKEKTLPQTCIDCEVRFACNGECPRHRFTKTDAEELGLSYLCKGYKKYFRHIHPYMKVMVQLIENGLPAAKIIEAIKGPLVFYNKAN